MAKQERLNREDVLNAVLNDPLADAVRRALELGYTPKEVAAAVYRGTRDGAFEAAAGVTPGVNADDYAEELVELVAQLARE